MSVTRLSPSRPGRRRVETSIVVRMFNEEKHLHGLFEGIERQTYRDFEIVVVDSGSFDRSQEISAQYADVIVNITPHDFTFGHSLNAGIEHCHGDFIVIVSAHTRPLDEAWLAVMIEALRNERVAMVYGCQRGPQESKFGEILDFERTFGVTPRVLTPPNYFANNANSAVRRSLWQEHPFDEGLPGLEDIEWAKYWMSRGHLVLYEPQAGIYHIHEESWPQVRRRYYREGQAAKWIGVRGRRDLPREVYREAAAFVSDLGHAARKGKLLAKGGEIARFRYEKLLGTVKGIWDGARLENPLLRERLLFDKPYKAVVIHRSGRASLEDMEVPQVKPGEILIRVAYQGVCGTDLEILDGKLGYYKDGTAAYPIVPGHEFSGTVARVGTRVTDVREGDRVVVECIQGCGQCAECRNDNAIGCKDRREMGVIGRNGGYADYVVTPSRFVHKLPADVGLREASLCEPLAVVLKGLRRLEGIRNPARTSRTVAVMGAGTIGHLAARILSHRGYDVTVFDRNQTRLPHFDGSSIKAAEPPRDLKAFDVIVEATGNLESLHRILAGARAGAILLLLGFPYGESPFNFERVVGYDLTVIGSVGSTARDFDEAIQTIRHLDLRPFFNRVLPLADFETAWQDARSGKALKVVLCVDTAQEDESRERRVTVVDSEPAERAANV
jgi:2-desacetyl-2-hydroxyethyl bacteriochlorophyllide A dehydrogenase